MAGYPAPEHITTFHGLQGPDLVRAVIVCSARLLQTYAMFSCFPDMERMPTAMAFLAQLTTVMRTQAVEADPYRLQSRDVKHGTAWTYQSACVVIRCAPRQPSTRRRFPWIGRRIPSQEEFQQALVELEDAALDADRTVALAANSLQRLDPLFQIRWTPWGLSEMDPRGVHIVPRWRSHWSPERWARFWSPATTLLDRAWQRCQDFLERLIDAPLPPQNAIPRFPDDTPSRASTAGDSKPAVPIQVIPDSGFWSSAHLPIWLPPFVSEGSPWSSRIWPEAFPSTPTSIIAGGACALSIGRQGPELGSAAAERMVRGCAAALRWAMCSPGDEWTRWVVSHPAIALIAELRRRGYDLSIIRQATRDLAAAWTAPRPAYEHEDMTLALEPYITSALSFLRMHAAAGGDDAVGVPALLEFLRIRWTMSEHERALRAVHRFLESTTTAWSADPQLSVMVREFTERFQHELTTQGSFPTSHSRNERIATV